MKKGESYQVATKHVLDVPVLSVISAGRDVTIGSATRVNGNSHASNNRDLSISQHGSSLEVAGRPELGLAWLGSKRPSSVATLIGNS